MFDFTSQPSSPIPSGLFVLTFLGFFAFSLLSMVLPQAAGSLEYAGDSLFIDLASLADLLGSLVNLLLQLSS